MNITAVKELISALEESGLYSLDYQDESFRLALSKGATVIGERAANYAAPAAPPSMPKDSPAEGGQAPVTETPEGVVVTAPLVGTVYRSREPQGPPLVSVGDGVQKDQPLCLIEAMKMYSEVVAPCNGIVREVLFDNGALAEYGAPLIRLEETV